MPEHITLAHGGGGSSMAALIKKITEILEVSVQNRHDAALLPAMQGTLAMTTDTFVVTPHFFPGGDIGRLSVYGTVNDLAMAGARAMSLAVALILEEGLPVAFLLQVIKSLSLAAKECSVRVVTGDVKVVGRGQADRLYICTTGIGAVEENVFLHPARVVPGDAVIVSGPIGEHGAAIMAEREKLNRGQLLSDAAPVWEQVRHLLCAVPQTRVLRDPTRGGVAAALREIGEAAGVAFNLEEDKLPVRREVRSFCSLLGIDPVHLACEGRFLAVVPKESASAALEAIKKTPGGEQASIAGEAAEYGKLGGVRLITPYGGQHLLASGEEELLPRIC